MKDKETVEELKKIFSEWEKFREDYLRNGFEAFKKNLPQYQKEFKEYYHRWKTSDFIDKACWCRGLSPHLEHRLMPDLFWFWEKAYFEVEKAWLWNFRELLYYFWRFYECVYELLDEDEEEEKE